MFKPVGSSHVNQSGHVKLSTRQVPCEGCRFLIVGLGHLPISKFAVCKNVTLETNWQEMSVRTTLINKQKITMFICIVLYKCNYHVFLNISS